MKIRMRVSYAGRLGNFAGGLVYHVAAEVGEELVREHYAQDLTPAPEPAQAEKAEKPRRKRKG